MDPRQTLIFYILAVLNQRRQLQGEEEELIPEESLGFRDVLFSMIRSFGRNRAMRMRRFLRRQRELESNFAALVARHYLRSSERRAWRHVRSGVWWQHVVSAWEDTEWLSNFRMKKRTFMNLCNILRPHLTAAAQVRTPLTVEQRLAVCIWRLSTNVEYRTISHLFGIGISTACLVVQQVVYVIVQAMLHQYIKRPSEQEFKVIIQGFRNLYGIPQCGGAIDGSHIGILAPKDDPADYYNRKGFYSIILQAVVDHRLRFWDVNIGWPGRVHDARVFGNSSLFEKGQSGTLFPNFTEQIEGVDVPVFMLGDAAYPLLPWLIKPYPETSANLDQKNFNKRLSSARMTVERAFGRLKGRWRCLMKRYDCHLENINSTVTACCILHNYCEMNNEVYVDADYSGEEDTNEMNGEHCAEVNAARTIRDALCASFAMP